MKVSAKPIEVAGRVQRMQSTHTWEKTMHRLLRDETGQDLVEYALIAVVIGLGSLVVLQGLTGNVVNVFTAVGNTLTGNA